MFDENLAYTQDVVYKQFIMIPLHPPPLLSAFIYINAVRLFILHDQPPFCTEYTSTLLCVLFKFFE